jgi:hypothetical protein
MEVYQVGCVGKQTAISGEDRLPIDRRYVVSGRRQYDWRAMHPHECIRHDENAASPSAPEGYDGGFDLCVAINGRSY